MSDDTFPPLENQEFDQREDQSVEVQSSEESSIVNNRQDSIDGDLAELASVNLKLAERKLKIEELRFRLEERKSDHAMMIEIREFDLKEATIERDRQLLLGENEHWMKSYWRSAAGWVYLAICAMDFILFPLLTMLVPIFATMFGITVSYEPWTSITLTEGGLIHLSFGAILGVTAWTRGKEKLAMRTFS